MTSVSSTRCSSVAFQMCEASNLMKNSLPCLIQSLLFLTIVCSLPTVFFDNSLMGQDVSPEHARFFENEVRPLLAENCFQCHADEKQKGDLRLDSLAKMLTGGESGAAVVPGKPEESLLIQAVRYESFEMPPEKKLSDAQIQILTEWIRMGAPWPGSDPSAPMVRKTASGGIDPFTDEDRTWWALQPVTRPTIPVIQDSTWARNDVDRFVLSRMLVEELSPAPAADRTSLARRLYFDVTGLPPTPEQVAAFVNDKSPDAYEQLVDRLLASPEYGEHAARQWLDLVRYADSDGYRADGYRDNAWRYRDYVIEAFNSDKPYDRFVQEQLAADELFPHEPDTQAALGYMRHWVYEWNLRDAPGQWKTILDDVTDTTADVFMGLGLQCAKCHNHKFDPLLQKDYFRLQAYFAPMMPTDALLADEAAISAHRAEKTKWEEATHSIRAEIAAIEAPWRARLKDAAINRFPVEIQTSVRKDLNEQTAYERQMTYLVMRQVDAEYGSLESKLTPQEKDRVLELKRQLETFKDQRPASLPVAQAVADVGTLAPPTTMPKRVDEMILPGIPSILDDQPAKIEPLAGLRQTTGRRAALAKWLTDPKNPLATRVIVNRIWQSIFGRGLAVNVSDFGRLGEPPTHPELLDYLTDRFVTEGWSIKSLRRLILTSAMYRQSTRHPDFASFQTVDPSNRWYWRADNRRLQAEQIRDAMLLVSGKLKSDRGGPGVLPDIPRRSIYTRVMRNSPDELLNSFDLPLFFNSNSSRNTTTTPVQALLLINSDLMLCHARALAESIAQTESNPELQVAAVWERVFGRRATPEELQSSIDFVHSQANRQFNLQKRQSESFSTIETAKLPYRDGQAVRFTNTGPNLELKVNHDASFNDADFTIEAFFQLRSVDEGAAVRTIAAKWNGDRTKPGWGFGVTGQGSRRKPQTLVLQLVGKTASGEVKEDALFSDHRITLDTPYYASASVRLATNDQPGKVAFHLKDISNDDEPLLTQEIETHIVSGFANESPFTIGGLSGVASRTFDGLIDDVRLVNRPLAISELLHSTEKTIAETTGFWRFETEPGLMANSAGDGLPIQARGEAIIQLEPSQAALVDFCHALLNSNEFLYVQ